MSSLPQLDYSTYPGQIFWLAVSFTLLYFVISRCFLPKLEDLLTKRTQEIDSLNSQANLVKKDSDSFLEECEKIKAESRRKIDDINLKTSNLLHEISIENKLTIARNIQILHDELASEIRNSARCAFDSLREFSGEMLGVFCEKFYQKQPEDINFEKYWMKKIHEMKLEDEV